MRKVYLALAGLLVLAVATQFYSAAMNALRPPEADAFNLHRPSGHITIALSLLAGIAALLARAPGRLTGLTFLVAGLAVLQLLLKPVANGIGGSDGSVTTTTSAVVFGLHGLNALVIAALVGMMFMRARALPAGSG